MQVLEICFEFPEFTQVKQQRIADTQTTLARCIAKATVHAGNPVSTMSQVTNSKYADQ